MIYYNIHTYPLKINLLGGNGIFREEFGENLDDVAAVEHALGAEVAAGSGRVLKEEYVSQGDVLDVDVGLDGVDVGLGGASQVFEYVKNASVHCWLEQWSQHQDRVDHHQVHA